MGWVGDTFAEVHDSVYYMPLYNIGGVLYVDDVVAKYLPETHPTAKFIDYTVTAYDKRGEEFPATHTLVPIVHNTSIIV